MLSPKSVRIRDGQMLNAYGYHTGGALRQAIARP
jgi:hypothetical protein